VRFHDRVLLPLFDRLAARVERSHFGPMRESLLAPTEGRVLEIGAGTGWSFSRYPKTVEEVVALEPNEGALALAGSRAAGSGRHVRLVRASAESLPFEDAAFDWAVAMFVLCTVPDPARALAELRRVLKPGGVLLFLEHVRSEEPRRARWQDRLERLWGAVAQGCHPNRDTVQVLRAAGFDVEVEERGELPRVPPLVKPYVRGRATPTRT
jgi:ubiquinone/menaquinone biosynthesis C-methylase UbiE